MRAFVIAMACEADTVRPFLRADDLLIVSGIGKVNAAAATQRAICEGANEIWNVGVCGGFGADVEVGDLFGIDRAVEYDFDLAQVNHTAIGVLDEYDTPYLPLVTDGSYANVPSFRGYRTLATGDHFNDSESDYALITQTLGASLRDMEGAAIAHVCRSNDIPCRAFKCVTNVAGRNSMTGQYAIHRENCLEILKQAMKEILK